MSRPWSFAKPVQGFDLHEGTLQKAHGSGIHTTDIAFKCRPTVSLILIFYKGRQSFSVKVALCLSALRMAFVSQTVQKIFTETLFWKGCLSFIFNHVRQAKTVMFSEYRECSQIKEWKPTNLLGKHWFIKVLVPSCRCHMKKQDVAICRLKEKMSLTMNEKIWLGL